jgi:hypothetical protein
MTTSCRILRSRKHGIVGRDEALKLLGSWAATVDLAESARAIDQT